MSYPPIYSQQNMDIHPHTHAVWLHQDRDTSTQSVLSTDFIDWAILLTVIFCHEIFWPGQLCQSIWIEICAWKLSAEGQEPDQVLFTSLWDIQWPAQWMINFSHLWGVKMVIQAACFEKFILQQLYNEIPHILIVSLSSWYNNNNNTYKLMFLMLELRLNMMIWFWC